MNQRRDDRLLRSSCPADQLTIALRIHCKHRHGCTPTVGTDSIETIALQEHALVAVQYTRMAGRDAVVREHKVRQMLGDEQICPALGSA